MTRPTQWLRRSIAASLMGLTALVGGCSSGGGGGGDGGGDGGAGGSKPEPVACDPLGGKPSSGDACVMVGELCDIPCASCQFKCGDDLIWHEVCWSCPPNPPTQGDACDPCVNTGECTYPVMTPCGPDVAIITCDMMTSMWDVSTPGCP